MLGLVVVSTTTLGSKQFTNVVSFDIITLCSSNSIGKSAILLSWKLWVRVPPGAPNMRIKENMLVEARYIMVRNMMSMHARTEAKI